MEKAKRILSMGNQYYFESEFEYRGMTYTVTYSSAYSTFRQKPAYIQHRENQKRIDDILDNPIKEEKKAYRYEDTADYAIDMFFEIVNAD